MNQNSLKDDAIMMEATVSATEHSESADASATAILNDQPSIRPPRLAAALHNVGQQPLGHSADNSAAPSPMNISPKEDNDETSLRKQILAIHQSDLSVSDKAAKIQVLLSYLLNLDVDVCKVA
jgi:hypothetical protein